MVAALKSGRRFVPRVAALLMAAATTMSPDMASAAIAPEWRVVTAAQAVRRGGCPGRAGIRAPLQREGSLDRVAEAWSHGGTLAEALQRAGVRAKRSGSLRLSGAPKAPALQSSLRSGLCTALTTADYASIGVHVDEGRSFIVVAQLFVPPAAADAGEIAQRSLRLVNRARASARRCGNRSFAAVPPLRASALLDAAAGTQARDLAANARLSHRGSDGSDPGTRATRAGYRWRVVGENVASGPQTAEEVISGWLDSPDHCENIMDPRYTEMGIAFAVNARSSGVIYWSQTFGLAR